MSTGSQHKSLSVTCFLSHVVTHYWIAPISSVYPAIVPSCTYHALQDLYRAFGTPSLINADPEDDNCNVGKNVGEPSVFFAAYSGKLKSYVR
jgi:hypothetical protein